jgi:hypothetical protein
MQWPRFPSIATTDDPDLQRKIEAALHLQRVVTRHMVFDSLNPDHDIMNYYEQMVNCVTYYHDYIKNVVKIRSENLDKYASSEKYNIISLGLDCLPRSICAKYGLIVSRKNGRMTCPFDLAVHSFAGMLHALQLGFCNYGDVENFSINNNGYVHDCKYSAVFNHDSEYVKLTNGFDQFSKKIKNRIKSFETYVLAPGFKIFFAHLPYSTSPDDATKISNIIKHRYSIKDFVVFALSTSILNTKKRKIKLECGYWHCIPIPASNYLWHDANYYATDQGVEFELKILDELLEIIDAVI